MGGRGRERDPNLNSDMFYKSNPIFFNCTFFEQTPITVQDGTLKTHLGITSNLFVQNIFLHLLLCLQPLMFMRILCLQVQQRQSSLLKLYQVL